MTASDCTSARETCTSTAASRCSRATTAGSDTGPSQRASAAPPPPPTPASAPTAAHEPAGDHDPGLARQRLDHLALALALAHRAEQQDVPARPVAVGRLDRVDAVGDDLDPRRAADEAPDHAPLVLGDRHQRLRPQQRPAPQPGVRRDAAHARAEHDRGLVEPRRGDDHRREHERRARARPVVEHVLDVALGPERVRDVPRRRLPRRPPGAPRCARAPPGRPRCAPSGSRARRRPSRAARRRGSRCAAAQPPSAPRTSRQ